MRTAESCEKQKKFLQSHFAPPTCDRARQQNTSITGQMRNSWCLSWTLGFESFFVADGLVDTGTNKRFLMFAGKGQVDWLT